MSKSPPQFQTPLALCQAVIDSLTGRSVQLLIKTHPELYKMIIEQTKFLPNTSGSKERCNAILNNITFRPLCLTCVINPVKWISNKYATYCSLTCKGSSEHVKASVRNTNQARLGVDNPSKSKSVKDKKVQTCLKTHGVSYPMQSKAVLDKSRTTMIKKYGVAYPLQSPSILNSVQQTNITRYGGTNPSHSSEIVSKRRTTSMELYNRPHFSQIHLPGSTIELLKDPNWLHAQHHVQKKSLSQIAEELGYQGGMSALAIHFKTHGIPIEHHFSSKGENEIGDFIQMLLPYEQIIRNSRSMIHPKELDIYIPSYNLAIEYCGLYWHSEQIGKDQHYHINKLNACSEQGIRLLTIFEDEWEHRKSIVKQKLQYILNLQDQLLIGARQCSIHEVSKHDKQIFFNDNHIQGDGPSSINIGLYNKDNVLVGCIGLIKKSTSTLLINRYATSHHIPGGFTKLVNHIKQILSPCTLITFADRRWSTGHLYVQAGFALDQILAPDYYYIDTSTNMRIHKFNLRHSRLQHILGEKYDPQKSEKQNTNDNNIMRIWNCGLLKFKLSL